MPSSPIQSTSSPMNAKCSVSPSNDEMEMPVDLSSPRTRLVVDKLGITREMLDKAASQQLPSRALRSGDPEVADLWTQLMAAKRDHYTELVLAEREHVTAEELAEYRSLQEYQQEQSIRTSPRALRAYRESKSAAGGSRTRGEDEEEDPAIARQREQVERTREELKSEILGMITSELAKKQLAAARQAQEAKFAKKLRTLKEDRQKLKEARQAVMDQKKKQREELLRRNLEEKDRLREEVQSRIKSKLNTVAERKQALAEIKKAEAEAFAEKLEEVKEKMRVERERLAAEAAARQAKSAEKQRQIEENKANLMQMLADAATVRSIEFSKRLAAAERIATETEASRQALGEEAKKRHEEAIRKNDRLRKEAWEAIKLRNRKHEEDIDKVRERAAKARLEHHQRVKEMYERKISRKDAAGEKAAREAFVARQLRLKREMYEDLVKINAARVANQHEHINQRRMLRISQTEAKLRDVAEAKEAFYQKRIMRIREGWAEKNKLKAELDKLKYCNSTRQFTRSVKRLGITLPDTEDPKAATKNAHS